MSILFFWTKHLNTQKLSSSLQLLNYTFRTELINFLAQDLFQFNMHYYTDRKGAKITLIASLELQYVFNKLRVILSLPSFKF